MAVLATELDNPTRHVQVVHREVGLQFQRGRLAEARRTANVMIEEAANLLQVMPSHALEMLLSRSQALEDARPGRPVRFDSAFPETARLAFDDPSRAVYNGRRSDISSKRSAIRHQSPAPAPTHRNRCLNHSEG